MEIEQRVRGGMSLAEATRTAMRAFGGVERHKEAVRDERGTRLIEEVASDVRLSYRAFRARPGFTATAAVTMAIGIAASTSVFSLANWIFVRPVPGVSAPAGVVRADIHRETGDPAQPRISPAGVSYPDLLELARGTPALGGLAATMSLGVQLSTPTSVAHAFQASAVAGDYFGILGVRPVAGRFFDDAERRPGSGATVLVLSDSAWHSVFAASPSVVGRTVRLNGTSFTVIGVAPRGFHGIDRIGDVDVWVPAAAIAILWHDRHFDLNDRSRTLFQDLFGRLEHGANAAAAQQQLRAALGRLALANPAQDKIFSDHLGYITADLGLVGFRRQSAADALRLLAVVAAIVLLISCANAANLLLLRGVRRQTELAVRRALGATAGRLIRQQIVEGLLLSTLGGVVGLFLTLVLRTALGGQRIPGIPPLAGVPIDWRVIAFALALSLTAGIAFAIVPALLSLHADFFMRLKETAGAGGTGQRLRKTLAIVQIAACTSLVVGGALLGRTLHALHAVDLGFDPDHAMAFFVDPSPQGYDAANVRRFRTELVRSLNAIPGVGDATMTSSPPMSGATYMADLRPGDYAGSDWPVTAAGVWSQPSYFAALGIPIVAGRLPDAADVATDSTVPDRVVVSRSLARQLYGAENPIGRTLVEREFRGSVTYVVAAVAADTRSIRLRGKPDAMIYLPFTRMRFPFNFVLLRTSRARQDVEHDVREAVAKLDPAVPVTGGMVLTDAVARNIADELLFAHVLTILALLTAALTAAGTYGIVAYFVAERTREIGVRVALGASASAVVALVTRQVVGMVSIGLAIGAVASVWLSGLLESKLFGVTPLDPSSYAIAGVFLMALGAIAALAPARAATRINPVDALRHE